MSKSLVEMAAEIVAAQASLTTLSPEEMADSLRKISEVLHALHHTGQEVEPGDAITMDPQASIQRNQVICLECGNTFKLLSNRHLALHGLTPRAYKQKHGIRMTQALSARTLSARRRKLAKDRGMGKQLAAWREDHKWQSDNVPLVALRS
jgi:predicted transcriptional regulator